MDGFGVNRLDDPGNTFGTPKALRFFLRTRCACDIRGRHLRILLRARCAPPGCARIAGESKRERTRQCGLSEEYKQSSVENRIEHVHRILNLRVEPSRHKLLRLRANRERSSKLQSRQRPQAVAGAMIATPAIACIVHVRPCNANTA